MKNKGTQMNPVRCLLSNGVNAEKEDFKHKDLTEENNLSNMFNPVVSLEELRNRDSVDWERC